MKIPVALPATTPSRPTSTTGQVGPRAEFQQLIHKLENDMWEGARAGDNRVDKLVAQQPSRQVRAASPTMHAQQAPYSPRSTAQAPQQIAGRPIGNTTNADTATPLAGADVNRQRQTTVAEHAASTVVLLTGWNTAATTITSTLAEAKAGIPTDPVTPALPPTHDPVRDGLVTVMQGLNGLSVSVRFKESDTLTMSDIHRNILQAIKGYGIVLDRLFINGNEASPATIKELNHGN